MAVEVQGVLGRGKAGLSKSRTRAVRSLLAALLGLVQAADKNEAIENKDTSASKPSPTESSRKDVAINLRASRRTCVPPDIWQDTLSLLCDHDYAIRADYSDTLIFYLREEMPKHGESTDPDGVKRTRRLADGPLQQAVNISLLHAGNFGTKFLHAIHAYLYILATTTSLGPTSGPISTPSTSPSHSTLDALLPPQLNVVPATPEERENDEPISPAQSHANGRRSFSAPQGTRAGKLTIVKRLLDQTPSKLSISASASLTDYALILNILAAIHEELPVRGLLTGIPMLLALDEATRIQDPDDASLERIHTIREVIAKIWLVLGSVWNTPELVTLAETVCSVTYSRRSDV